MTPDEKARIDQLLAAGFKCTYLRATISLAGSVSRT